MRYIVSLALLLCLSTPLEARTVVFIECSPGTYLGVTADGGTFVALIMGEDGSGSLRFCPFSPDSTAVQEGTFQWNRENGRVKASTFSDSAGKKSQVKAFDLEWGYETITINIEFNDVHLSGQLWRDTRWNRDPLLLEKAQPAKRQANPREGPKIEALMPMETETIWELLGTIQETPFPNVRGLGPV